MAFLEYLETTFPQPIRVPFGSANSAGTITSFESWCPNTQVICENYAQVSRIGRYRYASAF
jgi:hypothetical protein